MLGFEEIHRFAICAGVLSLMSLTGCGSGGGGDSAPTLAGGSGISISASPVGGNDASAETVAAAPPTSSSSGASDVVADVDVATAPEPVVDVVVAASVISWVPPFFREDGDFLSLQDVQGYRVYYGLEQGDYQSRLDVDGGVTAELDLADLPSGQYYLVITSIDSDGRESLYSEEFSITL